MDNLEKALLKQLSRFKEIGHNINNLDEQIVGGVGSGSGFKDQQGSSERLERFKKQQDIGEQEEEELELDPDAASEEIEGGDAIPVEDEEGLELDTELDTEIDTEIDSEVTDEVEDTTELDVTDLVTKQDKANTELADQKDILSKNTQSLDDLMDKLSDLESHLTSMDGMVSKIQNLENKIEEYRPKTEEEKISLRRYDSVPYNKTLSDFFDDKEEVFNKTGKKQYILTKDDVENFSDVDISDSFTDEEDQED
jgi:hypothetical protein|tara:strand:- start:81 stop:839 length:759 start_codon:yes stop_codon:yes gene_type:complete